MYQKYQTEALILGSRERGEADRVFALYTRDFGLVWARASGVRKEASLMRYALQSGAHAQVGLVRGKRGWRVAGAVALGQLRGSAGTAIFARVALLVLRLVHGQEENQYLFDALAEAHRALSQEAAPLATIEIVCVARTLYALGYLSTEAMQTTLFAHTTYALPHLEEAEAQREALLMKINKAIEETQL